MTLKKIIKTNMIPPECHVMPTKSQKTKKAKSKNTSQLSLLTAKMVLDWLEKFKEEREKRKTADWR